MSNIVLDIKNLTVRYNSDAKASIKNINLSIKSGECIAFIGESGCGKTTLIRSINGLAKHYYGAEIEGEVIFQGSNIVDFEPNDISRSIGTLFQNPRSQFFNVDTSAELIFGCENLGMKKEKIIERVEALVDELELDKLINRNIFELSGGEKQKIALASILAMNPSVFLLDEVSSNLDMYEVGKIKGILQKLKGEGKTIILSEHRMYWLGEIVDRYVLMEKGKIKGILDKEEMMSLSERKLEELGIRNFSMKQSKKGKLKKVFRVNSDLFQSIRDKKIKTTLNSFDSNAGIIGVIGKNGSGKSTLVEGLLHLIKNKGDIYLDGIDIKTQDCSYVMQDVTRQLFSESVKREIMLGNNSSEKEANNILRKLNLYDMKEYHPQVLSGGQKQRLAIATSILSKKKVCIMDEPTSGLDFRSMKSLGEVVNELNLMGTLVIIITHDLEIVDFCCDSIIEVDDGVANSYEYDYETLFNKMMKWYKGA